MTAYKSTGWLFWLFVAVAIIALFVATGMALGEAGNAVIIGRFLSMIQ